MQLGFVIDQTRCIGCHACTVACKSENHVPVGSFRTWVKYTEVGEFPSVKRSFAVLRCNQCTDAPCVKICPTSALEKRPDGIVDVNPDHCIGCKSCMHGCPYDALYIGEDGTAEKCHFCAHRTTRGLAPACAVVCPTEAIVPGDFDDPGSVVSRMKEELGLVARKSEAGTNPNVLYREAAPAGIDPNLALGTIGSGGQIWADTHPGLDRRSEEFDAAANGAQMARSTYNVAHPALWGGKITAYLFTKSVAAGVILAAMVSGAAPFWAGPEGATLWERIGLPLVSLAFLVATSLFLVFDLKRPERFLYILLRGNFSSWLVRGTWFLVAFGGLVSAWIGVEAAGIELVPAVRIGLASATGLAAALAACYTGWLFGQAKGRVLWMRRGLFAHLIVQALVAGSAALLLYGVAFDLPAELLATTSRTLMAWLGLHAIFTLVEGRMAPRKREVEYERTHRLVSDGPFARRHWRVGVGLGIILPLLLLAVPVGTLAQPFFLAAALLALIGLYVEEDLLVRAGQALPIS
ncbi:MAG TPA: 4Fe-4S ferredoxin [Planctomycetes bacterium]|nr:4Fe-4S ferredoxin [Planctomycetota bacterium]